MRTRILYSKTTWVLVALALAIWYKYSPQNVSFLISITLIAVVPLLILRYIFLDTIYKNSINSVSKKFVGGNNILRNNHCTVMYTPDEKIIVMDNISDRTHSKRMFTLTKKNLPINKAWYRVCRVFDDFITLDALESFYSYDTNVDLITIQSPVKPQPKEKAVNIERKDSGPKFAEMGSIKPDTFGIYEKNNNNNNNDSNDNNDFVNMNNLKEQEKYVQTKVEEQEFVGIGDILQKYDKKLDVNSVEAGELAVLPGINIVMAKKIIEYRNTNGLFKSIDDFIKVAAVKEHFISKIRGMIYIGEPNNDNPVNQEYEEGRIVDF